MGEGGTSTSLPGRRSDAAVTSSDPATRTLGPGPRARARGPLRPLLESADPPLVVGDLPAQVAVLEQYFA